MGVYSLASFDTNRGWGDFTMLTSMLAPFFAMLAVVWLPVGLAAGLTARKKGLRAARTMVLITAILAPPLFGCGFGMLVYS